VPAPPPPPGPGGVPAPPPPPPGKGGIPPPPPGPGGIPPPPFMKGGVPPPPGGFAAGPKRVEIKPKSKVRNFQWTKVPEARTRDTFFATLPLELEGFKIDFDA